MKSKTKATTINTKKSEKPLSIFARPWFVVALVVTCFAILTPKIFLPLLRQLFGFGKEATSSSIDENSSGENFLPPNLRNRGGSAGPSSGKMPFHHDGPPNPGPGDFPRSSGPQFGRQAYTPTTTGGSKSSVLSYLLPVYAIGIGIYMVYTLCKVFNKGDDEKTHEISQRDFDYDDNENGSDTELKRSKHVKFRERVAPKNSIQNLKSFSNQFQQRSEESEDEENDYERYKGLDPDYVSYLREARAVKRDEARKKAALKSKTLVKLNKIEEIPLTTNIGLTSITNTNVLMNDTLERMKYSLNKINTQLSNVEKKGGTSSMDDPELESLRLQLTQTEMQMAKIMSIVNTVSNTIQTENRKFKKKKTLKAEESDLSGDDKEDDDELDDEEDEHDLDGMHLSENYSEDSQTIDDEYNFNSSESKTMDHTCLDEENEEDEEAPTKIETLTENKVLHEKNSKSNMKPGKKARNRKKKNASIGQLKPIVNQQQSTVNKKEQTKKSSSLKKKQT